MILLTESDPQVGQALRASLAAVEARFAAELLSDLECVNELVGHIERYRGKMLRPTLVLVSAMACAPDGLVDGLGDVSESSPAADLPGREGTAVTEAHEVVSVVVEMVHMATLVHDDILDEAAVRRSGATVNGLRGNETAVMLGDYLISHAYHLCSGLDRQEIAQLIARTTNTVCEGELLQLANRENLTLGQATYFEIIRRKTGSLCGVCSQLGPLLHECDEAVEQAMYGYGEKLGMAFQIVDDLLDLTGEERTVGKTLGRDVQKGKLTLPLIHFLDEAARGERAEMLRLLGEEASTNGEDAERRRVLRGMLESAGSIEHARRAAEALVASARQGLAVLRDSAARGMMHEMAEAVLDRRY